MKKYYVVISGRKPGIYRSWPDCKEQTHGFKGAIFKSFETEVDAEQYIITQNQIIEERNQKQDNEIGIYTDGSHSRKQGYIGYGAYCAYKGNAYYISGECTPEKLAIYGIVGDSISNPTAEFIGFAEVLRILNEACLKMNKNILSNKRLHFYIDYNGVAAWMAGSWQIEKPYIQKIKDACEYMLEDMKVDYVITHIKGHSGIFGNEEADRMAKCKDSIDTFTELFEKISQE